MQKVNFYNLIIGIVIGFIIGFMITSRGSQIIDNIVTENVVVKTDTVYNESIVEIPTIEFKYLKAQATRDTVTKIVHDTLNVTHSIAAYDNIIETLMYNGFQRIKTFNKVTSEGDSISFELESVSDIVLQYELKLAARKVATVSYNNYLQPKPTEPESWYIKPAIAVSTFGLGYLTGSLGK